MFYGTNPIQRLQKATKNLNLNDHEYIHLPLYISAKKTTPHQKLNSFLQRSKPSNNINGTPI